MTSATTHTVYAHVLFSSGSTQSFSFSGSLGACSALVDVIKNKGTPDTCAGTNPCNAGTGNKFQHETDYVGVGVYPLHVGRIYNSGNIDVYQLGSNWRNFYDRTVLFMKMGSINLAVSSSKCKKSSVMLPIVKRVRREQLCRTFEPQ